MPSAHFQDAMWTRRLCQVVLRWCGRMLVQGANGHHLPPVVLVSRLFFLMLSYFKLEPQYGFSIAAQWGRHNPTLHSLTRPAKAEP